jgi:putative sigma-54 modulation protein
VQVKLCARRIELDDAVRASTIDKVSRLSRFVPGMDHAEVRFFEERNPRIAANEVCEVTVTGHGHHVRAKASAISAPAALDLCIEKLEHQLYKLKGKLDGRHHGGPKRGKHHQVGLGHRDVDVDAPVPAALNGLGAGTQLAMDDDPNVAKVVKSKQFVVSPMSVDEAALNMDLLQHDFFLFTNQETGRPAVVYPS